MIVSFAEGSIDQACLLGNKGARLADLMRLGCRVPDGFTLTTEACRAFYEAGEVLTSDIEEHLFAALGELECRTGKRFGDPSNPLLLAIRSGSPESMPGMMDTILNLGLNDAVVQGLAERTSDAEFAADCYRRFQQMYRTIATDVIPNDPKEQLLRAVAAVFASWNNRRAVVYRRIHGISDQLFTAANVQEMVFGNLGTRSASGVVFSRHPSTGAPALYGETLLGAQGDDVVSGMVTPHGIELLEERMPDVYAELVATVAHVEAHYQDMQEIEFTVQQGILFLLQTRDGKRTTEAAVKIAVDLVRAGLVDRRIALQRVESDAFQQLLHLRLDRTAVAVPLASGIPVVHGAVVGAIALDSETALTKSRAGHSVLLVRRETDPNDYEAMTVASGILTAFGGSTSHAAVTARPLGVPCIVGCAAISIDLKRRTIQIGHHTFAEGELLTLDGESGCVYAGALPLTEPELLPEVAVFRAWLNAEKQG
ncbi:pyruvate, phosphate dikinase [Tumebacillus algifaecis]|uniref:pyruvate, phosphate dikinase n=1 Tax=Tumebacillus algifaecis TaxID=1214604 RepID=UPI0012FDA78C|nr:pyruvate, phosphate dikinase [Tumebacillus algifaecis]